MSAASQFTRATARWVAAGLPVVSEAEYREREAICNGCRHWNPEGYMGWGKCEACGCTKFKRWLATETCPKGKWNMRQGRILTMPGGAFQFMCPGCKKFHYLHERTHLVTGDAMRPTVRPEFNAGPCTGRITEGQVRFGKAHHVLAGLTAELPVVTVTNRLPPVRPVNKAHPLSR